jgi:hypothetical protein
MGVEYDLMEGSVADIPDEQLLRRAVSNCRDDTMPSGVYHPRWTGVMRTFALGSAYAHQLCRRFGFDPDEMVVRRDRD